MERWMRALLLAVGVGVAAVVLVSIFVDEGEVVTLLTHDREGAEYETQLWIVDLEGLRYLRATAPGAAWLSRIRENPAVLIRPVDAEAGMELTLQAVPVDDPAMRDAINGRMAEKYGWADQMWSWVLDRTKSVPIRLEPRQAP